MSSLIFSSKIEDESLAYISIFIDSLESKINELKGTEKVNIYFISGGGQNDLSDVITDILNKYQKKIILIGSGFLFSNGLVIFARFKGTRRLLPNSMGMAHLSSFLAHTRELTKTISYENAGKYQIQDVNEELTNLFSPLLTSDELERFCNGEEVYLPYKRLKQMFKIK